MSAHSEEYVKRLKFDEIQFSRLTATREVCGIYRNENQLYIFPDKSDYFFTTSIGGDPKDGDPEKTRSDTDLEGFHQISFPKEIGKGSWRGTTPFLRGSLLFLDGDGMRVAIMEKIKFSIVSHGTIVLDLLIPPKDSRGESGNRETSQFREKFEKAFTNFKKKKPISVKRSFAYYTSDDNLEKDAKTVIKRDFKLNPIMSNGIISLPESWENSDKAQFLLSSQLEGFPLLKMKCSEDNLGNCKITRACYAEKLGTLKSDYVTGIAVSKKRDLLLIGDILNHEIVIFKYHSCYNIRRIGSIKLPYQIFEIRSLFVDDADNLFVTTYQPDNYTNSSLYMWSSVNW